MDWNGFVALQRTVNFRFDTHRKNPFEIVLDDTPDISEYMGFSFYSCYFQRKCWSR